MLHVFKELGKVVSRSKKSVRVEWIGRKEAVNFEQLKNMKVGQWFSADATREGASISTACLSKTLSVDNVKRIGSLDKQRSNKEWQEVLDAGKIDLPKASWEDI